MRFLYFILITISFLSCASSKENIYLSTGTDYSSKPYRWTIGCKYDSLNYDVIDSVIGRFGNNFNLTKSKFEEKYVWTHLKSQKLSKQPLNITVIRRIDKTVFLDGTEHELEYLAFYIKKNNKDYLGPLQFIHRTKVKKFLIELVEH